MEDQRASAESIPDGTPAERFAEQLRALRTVVGNPSFRKMAGRSGRISHTTLHEAAAGTRFPTWETTREYVRACEADEIEWRRRWEAARGSGTVNAAPDGDPMPEDQRAPEAAEHPRATAESEVTGARRYRWPTLAATAVAVVATAAVLGFALLDRSSPGGSGAEATSKSPSPLPSGSSDALIPGDSSKFVADVTIPDGTRVTVNAHFTKVWALANVGTVHWHNRFLARMNPAAEDDGCQVPDRVVIGDTAPGEQVMISVPVTAPNRPGKCWVSWKMVDERGQAYFPSRRPVYFMVTVVA